METITAKAPWLPSMDGIPAHLDYFEGSMFDKVEEIAAKYGKHEIHYLYPLTQSNTNNYVYNFYSKKKG